MGEEAHPLGEGARAVGGRHVVHVDVVGGDVGVGGGHRLGDALRGGGGDPLREPLGQPDLGPLAAAPRRPLLQLLLERRLGEVQQGDEGQLRGERIGGEVGRRVVAGEDVVHRQARADVEVGAAAQVPAERRHVPFDPLLGELEPVEERVERRPLRGVVLEGEVEEDVPRAVVVLPEGARLLQPALDPRPFGGAVPRRQLGPRLIHRGVERQRLLGRGRGGEGEERRGEEQEKQTRTERGRDPWQHGQSSKKLWNCCSILWPDGAG